MLSVREVTTAYQGLVAISSVSIDVTKGEIVCVAGANGAGKSTLLKSIAGAERPRAGTVTFDGTRIDGQPQHVITAGGIAFVAGLVTATSAEAMNTRVVNSNMIYDVILVVVLGGVGLSGGRGNVRNVIVGALLIGVLMNGMTIMHVQYTIQNVIKSLILLLAIVVDSILNPRDEQTGQQGDI